MNALVVSMETELEALERELSEDPRFQKITYLRELIAIYRSAERPKKLGADTQRRVREAVRRHAARKEALYDAIRSLLKDADHPVKTAFLLEVLPDEIRKQIGGKDPVSTLSALLSNAELLVSHGRLGWTLADKAAASPKSEPRLSDDVEALLE